MKEKLLISACLLGENCKYSGGNNYLPAVEDLQEHYMLVPVCPERDGGLPVPRTPAERLGVRVINQEGIDVTAAYVRGAEIALASAKEQDCTKALLKARSPSCGSDFIYDGSFTHTLIPGQGITAELLRKNGIAVYSENHIHKLY